MSAIVQGSTIGILGGGQLGRMTAMAARSLGYRVQVMDPDPSCPARFVVDACFVGSWDDATRGRRSGSRLRCDHAGDRADFHCFAGSCGPACSGAPGQGDPGHGAGPDPAEELVAGPGLSRWDLTGPSIRKSDLLQAVGGAGRADLSQAGPRRLRRPGPGEARRTAQIAGAARAMPGGRWGSSPASPSRRSIWNPRSR